MENNRLEIRRPVPASRAREFRTNEGSSHFKIENHRQNCTASRQIVQIFATSNSSTEVDNTTSTTNSCNKASAIYGPLQEYSRDLSSLISNPMFSDVDIHCGGEVIKVHKNILASRSPVFKAMFSNSMLESATGVVTVEDLDVGVVRDLIDFIYGNKLNNLSLIKACGLLEASTKYQIQTLKDCCVDFLIHMLTKEHAVLILQKADLYDEKLKTFTINFIREKFVDLRRTEEWIMLKKDNPVLALEVCGVVIDDLVDKS